MFSLQSLMEWSPNSWEWTLLIRLLISWFCGAVIGFERTKRYKEAGVRTHIIVCCASALMMILSKYGFTDLLASEIGGKTADGGRIAAQVVSGISFLCAAVIFKDGNSIKGLTTAAGLWYTAGVGMVFGAGLYWIGVFSTFIIVISQLLMHRIPLGNDAFVYNEVKITVSDSNTFWSDWQSFVKSTNGHVENNRTKYTREGMTVFSCVVRTKKPIPKELWRQFMQDHTQIMELEHRYHS